MSRNRKCTCTTLLAVHTLVSTCSSVKELARLMGGGARGGGGGGEAEQLARLDEFFLLLCEDVWLPPDFEEHQWVDTTEGRV